MSTTHTSPSALKQQSSAGRFWLVGILTIVAALVVNTIVVLAAHAAFTVAPTFVPLQLQSVIPATVFAVAGANIVFALMSRRSQQPARLFRRVAGGILLVSIIPDLLLPVLGIYPGTTLQTVGALLVMHVATALICISSIPRAIDARA